MRLGLFGGTFDPVHTGHLALIKRALTEGKLDRVIVMPAKETPKKAGALIAGEEDRLEMVRLAVDEFLQSCPECRGKIAVSDWEIRQNAFTYTIDTLHHLRSTEIAFESVVLILGDDSLDSIKKWKCGPEILLQYEILSFSRETTSPVSSTEVRERLFAGEPVNDRLPVSVLSYIREHGLYQSHR